MVWFRLLYTFNCNHVLAISGLSSRNVGNPYIVYGISVNNLIYGMTNQTLPNFQLVGRIITQIQSEYLN